MKTICLYTRSTLAIGIIVILDNIKKALPNVEIPIVTNIDEAIKYDVVIPYAILEANDLMKKDRAKCHLSLMVDAISLIDISQYKYFVNKNILSIKEQYSDLLRYYYHSYLERKIFKAYDNVVLVSYGDKSYFENKCGIRQYAHKISVIQNGVNLPTQFKRPRRSDGKIVLGFLRSWGAGQAPVHREERCFLEYVWKEVQRLNSNIILKMCGRGMSQQQKDYFKRYQNVEGIGEVSDLKDYFDQIDINIMIMPKHGGILNKILDGFAYKCPTIGEPHNFWAFKDIPDCYYTYSNAQSLVRAVEHIMHNHDEVQRKVDMAYEYMKVNHDWDVNYKLLQKMVAKLIQ